MCDYIIASKNIFQPANPRPVYLSTKKPSKEPGHMCRQIFDGL